MDVIDICVPTPLRKTKDPDLSFVVKAVEAVAATLRPGQLVILESTTYPGTTDEVVQPMLELKGLRAEVDFFLAFSPERVDPGNTSFTTRTIPKVVGGVGPASTELASALYRSAVSTVVQVSAGGVPVAAGVDVAGDACGGGAIDESSSPHPVMLEAATISDAIDT